MDAIYKKILHCASHDTVAALCIITRISGSAPGKPGMKMLVYEDGTIEGTVGGGAIEKEVIDKAMELMFTSTPAYFAFNLKNDLSMECGGAAEVYIEPVNQKKKLYIFGGGHIGKSLSGFASEVGFSITVIDERPGIFDTYSNPSIKTDNRHFNDAIKDIKFDKRTFLVIVTHKHIHDYDILKLLCNKTYAYLGMIGSRVKVEKIRKELIQKKLTTKDIAHAIDMPIGIKFKALTHTEIAISILAKLIDVKNNI